MGEREREIIILVFLEEKKEENEADFHMFKQDKLEEILFFRDK